MAQSNSPSAGVTGDFYFGQPVEVRIGPEDDSQVVPGFIINPRITTENTLQVAYAYRDPSLSPHGSSAGPFNWYSGAWVPVADVRLPETTTPLEQAGWLNPDQAGMQRKVIQSYRQELDKLRDCNRRQAERLAAIVRDQTVAAVTAGLPAWVKQAGRFIEQNADKADDAVSFSAAKPWLASIRQLAVLLQGKEITPPGGGDIPVVGTIG